MQSISSRVHKLKSDLQFTKFNLILCETTLKEVREDTGITKIRGKKIPWEWCYYRMWHKEQCENLPSHYHSGNQCSCLR